MSDNPIVHPPDFLFFIVDQYHPGCTGFAGHPLVKTPNLDTLASQGTVFNRAYTPQPLCMPARASLFTGRTPRGHGVRMNGISLNPAIPTFTGALSQAGYQTHCSGKIHLRNSAPPRGVSLAKIDPVAYPECRPLWLNNTITDLPLPYYGLQSVDYVNGHGHNSYGHYVHWLRENYPKEAKLFFEETPLEPPSPASELFNRSSYKWALPAELHPMRWIADRSIDYLQKISTQRQADQHQPFMLMCSIQEPHSPLAPPAPYCYQYDPADIRPLLSPRSEFDQLPPHFRAMYETSIRTSGNHSQPMRLTAPYYAECVAHYYGLISMIDDEVGRVMNALKTSGLSDNTVVIFLADHGEALGEHGMWGKGPYHYDSVIRVPLIISHPDQHNLGKSHEGIVSLLDIAPTVLDMAGVPTPEGMIPAEPEATHAPNPLPGQSLLPFVMDELPDEDSTALIEMDEDYLGLKIRTIVTQQHRLTVYSGQAYGELYDLKNDPHESLNLWDELSSRSLRDDLHIQLLHKILLTDNSLPRQMGRA